MMTTKGQYLIHDEYFDIQFIINPFFRSEPEVEYAEDLEDYRLPLEPEIVVTDETEAGVESEVMPIGGEISEEVVDEDPVVENLPDDVVMDEEQLSEDEMAEVVNELKFEQETATEEYFNEENIEDVAIE